MKAPLLFCGSSGVALALALAAGIAHVRAQIPPASQTPPRDSAPAQTATGRIGGRIVNAEDGAPLRRALVTLGSGSGPQGGTTVATDEQGRYEFATVPAGSYVVTASKAGYVSLAFGQRRPAEPGRSIPLGRGETTQGIDIALPRGAVIVAHVVDDVGQPVAGIYVRPLQNVFSDGERQFVPAGVLSGIATDGTGTVHLHGLLPGDYYLAAGSSAFAGPAAGAGSGRMFGPTYYPGSASAGEAQRITVRIGQLVDATLPLLAVKPARIAGRIRTSDGAPFTNASAFLGYRVPGGSGSRNLQAKPDGTFAADVIPGDYTIDVAPYSAANGVQEFASIPIRVTGDDQTNLVVTTGSGGLARGRILFDTGTPPPNLRPGSIPVTTVPVLRKPGSGPGRRSATTDWTFETKALFTPVVFRLGSGYSAAGLSGPNAPGASGWFLKAVRLDGRDVTDMPLDFSDAKTVANLEVVLTQTRTTVEGTAVGQQEVQGVQGVQGAATSEYAAVFFPEEHDQWTPQSSRIGTARSDRQGKYQLRGLPPGNYLAAAVDYLPPGEERDPQLLQRLAASAVRFTLAEGESKTVPLTVAS